MRSVGDGFITADQLERAPCRNSTYHTDNGCDLKHGFFWWQAFELTAYRRMKWGMELTGEMDMLDGCLLKQ